MLTVPKKQQQQQAENAEGGGKKKKKVTAAQLRVQRGRYPLKPNPPRTICRIWIHATNTLFSVKTRI